MPGTESVHFISTTSARGGTAKKHGKLKTGAIQKIIDHDDGDSPLFFHFEHIPSSFVRIKLNLGTSALPLELKPLLSLYVMNFFTTPVNRDGKRLEFEDLVLELERETVQYDMDFSRANNEMLSIGFHTEPENYERVIGWLRTLLFDAIHDPERLFSSLTKLLADIPDEKRSGDAMSYAVSNAVLYSRESSIRARNTLSKALYLKRLRKLLETDQEAVIAQFTELCKILHRPENLRIFVSADIEKLPTPVSAWTPLTSGLDTGKPLEPLDDQKAFLSDAGKKPGSSAYIIPMATIDSSFGLLTAKGPDSYDHPDFPALRVARAYMDAVEGPLWVAVRGTGLAYGTSFFTSVDTGLFQFRISRSPDVHKAFAAAKEQVEGYATGKLSFDKFALEGAVSEIVLGMADQQPTISTAAEYSYTNQVIRGISKDWSHETLTKIQAVKPEEIRAVMLKYMVPVFQPESSNLVITCANIMREALEANFADYKPEVRTLESFQDDYGLAGDDADESEEDEFSEYDVVGQDENEDSDATSGDE